MMRIAMQTTVILGFVGLSTASSDGSTVKQSWLYTEVNNRGPSHWKNMFEKCGGNEQSPIDIARPTPDPKLKPLEFHYHVAHAYSAVHTVSSVKFVPHEETNEENYFIDPNLGNKKFKLAQLHFHSPSEHSIGGSLYELEVHLVHLAAEDQPPTASPEHNVAVVGVLFSANDFATNNVLNVFSDLPDHPNPELSFYNNSDLVMNVTTEEHTNVSFDFGRLVRSSGYFTYKGSFTTPPCTEGVRWYVVSDIGRISSSQLSAFRTAMLFEEEEKVALANGWVRPDFHIIGNNRPTRPLNDRSVSEFVVGFNQENEGLPDKNDPSRGDRKHPTPRIAEIEDDDEASKLSKAALVVACVSFVIALVAIILSFFFKKSQNQSSTRNEPASA